MKKVIVGLVVGLSMVMANTAYGTVSATTEVQVNIAPALVLEVEAVPSVSWDLKVGSNERSGGIRARVKSNATYTISVRSDVPKMREYIVGAPDYVSGGRELQYPLVLKEEKASWTPTESVTIGTTEANIPRCVNLAHTPHAGVLTQFDLRQEIVYDDKVLPTGKVYRMRLIFSAYHNIF